MSSGFGTEEAVLRLYGCVVRENYHQYPTEPRQLQRCSSCLWRCNFTFPRNFQSRLHKSVPAACSALFDVSTEFSICAIDYTRHLCFRQHYVTPSSSVVVCLRCECCGYYTCDWGRNVNGLRASLKFCDVAFYVVVSRIHDF